MEMLSGDLALLLLGAKDIATFELPLADEAGSTGVSLAHGWALRFYRGHGTQGFLPTTMCLALCRVFGTDHAPWALESRRA